MNAPIRAVLKPLLSSPITLGLWVVLAAWLALDQSLLFWIALAFSLSVGVIAAYPVNAGLITLGVKEGMMNAKEMR